MQHFGWRKVTSRCLTFAFDSTISPCRHLPSAVQITADHERLSRYWRAVSVCNQIGCANQSFSERPNPLDICRRLNQASEIFAQFPQRCFLALPDSLLCHAVSFG